MINVMEVCGTHTRVIAKEGIKQLFAGKINLLSGPGCPVCVTDDNDVDLILQLAAHEGVIICSFADMLHVPGLKNLPNTKIIYSPKDALALAQKTKKNIVLLAVGFETTAPLFAAVILEAKAKKIKNFFVFCTLKTITPAIAALLSGDNNIDAFLLPGNVSIITGYEMYDLQGKRGVVAGFERGEIIAGLNAILAMKTPQVQNIYAPVTLKGNARAQELVAQVFTAADGMWRGLGKIKKSALKLKKGFEMFDAVKKFKINPGPAVKENKDCMCAYVLQGKITPQKCKMFGKKCTPAAPLGPCMVSREGACNAEFSFR